MISSEGEMVIVTTSCFYAFPTDRVNGTDQDNDNERCVFPFYYQEQKYDSCTTINNAGRFWCATTDDYDQDRLWANCY